MFILKAIKVIDSWMEYNAVIDSEKCIQCNACHSACQNNAEQVLTKPIYWKQGWAQDDCVLYTLHLEELQQQ